MIRNDLHVHSVQSACGMHTLLEIVEIASRKGMRLVNITDHGSASGKKMNFGVITDKRRCPAQISSSQGKPIRVLAGIEASFLDIDGNTDLPQNMAAKFDLISAGFHFPVGKTAQDHTTALKNYLEHHPLDILTHPCIATYPLNLEQVVELSLEHGFALEVNNTNLRVQKTDVRQLERLIHLSRESGIGLVENSDGHTFFEIGENDRVAELLQKLGFDGDELFINRDDARLDEFLAQRKQRRQAI